MREQGRERETTTERKGEREGGKGRKLSDDNKLKESCLIKRKTLHMNIFVTELVKSFSCSHTYGILILKN